MPTSAAASAFPEMLALAICGASTLVVAMDSATASANNRSFEPK